MPPKSVETAGEPQKPLIKDDQKQDLEQQDLEKQGMPSFSGGELGASGARKDNEQMQMQVKGFEAVHREERRGSLISTDSRRSQHRTKGEFARAMDYIKDLKELPEDSPIREYIAMFCEYVAKPVIMGVMTYIWFMKQAYQVYQKLPLNVLNIIFGLGLCFFGGLYFTAIAAIEAVRQMGGEDLWLNLSICYNEANSIVEASKKDDDIDADGNGIPDVEEMSANDLINHKAKLAFMAVKDPQKLQKAMMALLNVWVAVIATLKYQFAKTLAVSLGIAEMLALPAVRIAGPFACGVVGRELTHWVPTLIDTLVKVLAVIIASYLQACISAFYSGLRGGNMVAMGFFNMALEHGWMDELPDEMVTKPFDPDKSYLDEAVQYPLAAFGFYFQLMHGFQPVFPLDAILLPLTIVEWILRFQVYT